MNAGAAIADQLVEYLRDHYADLDEDSQRRLETNPLRILDSKNPDMQTMIEAAPALHDSLDDASQAHFQQLRDILDQTGIEYEVNQRLVRGLDYYSHTVFEWITDKLGAQGTVCGGGRYDGLIEQLGGKPGHAAGFSMGCERLIAMLVDQGKAETAAAPAIYFAMRGDNSIALAQGLAEGLRDRLPGLEIIVHAGAGSFKSQMRKADKSGARIALILGEAEIGAGVVAIKYLREDRPQEEVAQSDLIARIETIFSK